MPRTCTVCNHRDLSSINKAIVSGEPERTIAERYSLKSPAIHRHKENHLPASLVKSEEAKAAIHSVDVMAELQKIIERVNLLSDACDRWLRDPDDPSRYDIGPRAEDVKVTYEEEIESGDGFRTIRKKAPLSELLARIEGRYTITAVETKHADPRELLLKGHDRLQSRLELVAKLLGEIDDSPTINVTISPQWLSIRAVIVQALASHPEARQAVAKALQEIDHAGV